MYVCMYVRTYVCMHACTYVCMHVYMYVYMYVCMYVCPYVRMCVCMHACTYICIYMYICVSAFLCYYTTVRRPGTFIVADAMYSYCNFLTHNHISLLFKFPTSLSKYKRAILKHFNTGTEGILKFTVCPTVCTGAFVTDKTHYVHEYTSPESDGLLLR
jgi:hypothetical protein